MKLIYLGICAFENKSYPVDSDEIGSHFRGALVEAKQLLKIDWDDLSADHIEVTKQFEEWYDSLNFQLPLQGEGWHAWFEHRDAFVHFLISKTLGEKE